MEYEVIMCTELQESTHVRPQRRTEMKKSRNKEYKEQTRTGTIILPAAAVFNQNNPEVYYISIISL